jgi:hypothetical protein
LAAGFPVSEIEPKGGDGRGICEFPKRGEGATLDKATVDIALHLKTQRFARGFVGFLIYSTSLL